MHTDFSGAGLGVVLKREDEEGREYGAEFASRSRRHGAELNYTSYKGCECLAMLWQGQM